MTSVETIYLCLKGRFLLSLSLAKTETKIRGIGLLHIFIAAVVQAMEFSHLLDAY